MARVIGGGFDARRKRVFGAARPAPDEPDAGSYGNSGACAHPPSHLTISSPTASASSPPWRWATPISIPLWFGETDLVTPAFIRDAAKRALDDGKTFYIDARGIMPLREAIAEFHKRTIGADVGARAHHVPGAAMLAVVTALQCVVETGDNVVDRLADLAQHLPGRQIVRRGAALRAAGRRLDARRRAGGSISISCSRLRRAHQGDLHLPRPATRPAG